MCYCHQTRDTVGWRSQNLSASIATDRMRHCRTTVPESGRIRAFTAGCGSGLVVVMVPLCSLTLLSSSSFIEAVVFVVDYDDDDDEVVAAAVLFLLLLLILFFLCLLHLLLRIRFFPLSFVAVVAFW